MSTELQASRIAIISWREGARKPTPRNDLPSGDGRRRNDSSPGDYGIYTVPQTLSYWISRGLQTELAFKLEAPLDLLCQVIKVVVRSELIDV